MAQTWKSATNIGVLAECLVLLAVLAGPLGCTLIRIWGRSLFCFLALGAT